MVGFRRIGHIRFYPNVRSYPNALTPPAREPDVNTRIWKLKVLAVTVPSSGLFGRSLHFSSPFPHSIPPEAKNGFRVRLDLITPLVMSPKTPRPGFHRLPFSGVPLASLALAASTFAASSDPIWPTGTDGQSLNLNFETGDLRHWTPDGNAFEGQPIQGDTVKARRPDMPSRHTGSYWIGTYERFGDPRKGTLTSTAFKVTHPWASFRVAGGPHPETRVELAVVKPAQDGQPESESIIFKVSGLEHESLRPVVVDLSKWVGQSLRIRLVDQHSGGWGHINFDDFLLHAEKPSFPDELSLAEIRKSEPPPADDVGFAGLSAEEAAKAAKLPPGFKMHVFASEPDVRQPIAFCEDDRGRLWVAEGYTYPKRMGHPPKSSGSPSPSPDQLKDIFSGRDRILVLEDTDGDHRFDKRTVFAENVNLISGMEYGFGGLWVGAAPYLMFFPIADGESPRLAGDPKVLLDGWNYSADTHETLNTFTWGPDGWLYGCHGVFCPSNVGKPGVSEADRQWMDAGVWRYHPVRHQFEVFTEGGSNPWGIDFDERGQLWAEMCVIPHLFHMIQGARLTRQGGEHFAVGRDEIARNAKHRHKDSRKPVFPYVYEEITTHADHLHYAGNRGPHAANGRSDSAGGGHAHAGVLCYLGTSWPATYRGNLFLGNIHGQRLNMEIPVLKGSGMVGTHGPDFLNFNDTWSQTLNQRCDPDGSMYVIDWYDKNQCHHNREDGHDRGNGRIYKVVYNNQAQTKVDLGAANDEALVKAVTSKNEWMSRHARRLLQERVAKAAKNQETPDNAPADWAEVIQTYRAASGIPALAALKETVDTSTDTAARLRALWALHSVRSIRLEDAGRWAQDRDEWVRAWVVQLFFENAAMIFSGDDRVQELATRAVESLTRLAREDSSPVVRRAVASALQRVPVKLRWEPLLALVQHSEDIGDHNLPQLYWYAAEGAVSADPDKALELLRASKIPKLREHITRRLASQVLAKSN